MTTNTLVIVESGAKAKTISKYLNGIPEFKEEYGRFDVVASFGHVLDLGKKGMGVDLDTFLPNLEVISDKSKLVKELKKLVTTHTMVLLASDADREGAAIASHLRHVLKLSKKKYKRITFTEITPNALKNAIVNAGEIDEDLVQAQQARRVLDRLVGYQISPLLWQHFENGGILRLSAGRVQSATLHMVVERHEESKTFESRAYYSIHACYDGMGDDKAMLYTDMGCGVKVHIDTRDEASALLQGISKHHEVRDVSSKERRESPPLPYLTSTLQQDAHTKLGISVKATMKLAQDLYEAGAITYMRTDSTDMAEDAKLATSKYIESTFGGRYKCATGTTKRITKGGKHSQEAHECIRPTNVDVVEVDIGKAVTKDHKSLYTLIWTRAIASQMAQAVFDEQTIIILEPNLSDRRYAFVAKSRVVKFDGFHRVYGVQKEQKTRKLVPVGKIKCKHVTAIQTWSTPPPRYGEATLIKAMEQNGIGRPSTYASVLGKLTEKQYVSRTNIAGAKKECVDLLWKPSSSAMSETQRTLMVGEEKSKLVPTEIGCGLDAFITTHFQNVADVSFTSDMENVLDKISKGEAKYANVMSSFWNDLSTSVKLYASNKPTDSSPAIVGDTIVIRSGGIDYTIRHTKYGPAIQYLPSKDAQTKYISLKAYMKITGKTQLNDIDSGDLKFIVSLPNKMENDANTLLYYGQYGFYIKKGSQSFSMFIGKHYTSSQVPHEILKLSPSELDKITSWSPKQK